MCVCDLCVCVCFVLYECALCVRARACVVVLVVGGVTGGEEITSETTFWQRSKSC